MNCSLCCGAHGIERNREEYLSQAAIGVLKGRNGSVQYLQMFQNDIEMCALHRIVGLYSSKKRMRSKSHWNGKLFVSLIAWKAL